MTLQGRGAILAAGIPAVLLAAVVIFAGYGWVREHDARVRAETQTGQQQQQIDGLKQQQAAAQQVLANKLAGTETAALLPGLPEALQVRSAPENPSVPNGPVEQTVVVPEADFKIIRNAQLACEEDTVKLAACQSSQAESTQQLKLTEAQRDEWQTTAKGGSIWHRALSAAKWFAVGAGSGAVAYAVVHHK
jgi:hypothetical protein